MSTYLVPLRALAAFLGQGKEESEMLLFLWAHSDFQPLRLSSNSRPPSSVQNGTSHHARPEFRPQS